MWEVIIKIARRLNYSYGCGLQIGLICAWISRITRITSKMEYPWIELRRKRFGLITAAVFEVFSFV